MYYELALISVVIGSGYWGYHFVRQESYRLYGVLNLIAAALAGIGFYGSRYHDGAYGIAGAIGVGAGTCFLLIGPMARNFARRAAAAERFVAAKYLLDVADVLAPGSGVGEEKALLAAMREIRDGNIDQTVNALAAAKTRAPREAHLAIDERIAMLYLAAYRWNEAIAHAEEFLFAGAPAAGDAEVPPPTLALRRALGIAPPVWVELLGAYAYVGRFDDAARMLARLEDVCADRADAGVWLHRARMIFLSLAGRVAGLERLIEPKRARHVKPAARQYWLAMAHERAGETEAARDAYRKARAGSRGRPRLLIDQAIARLDGGSADGAPAVSVPVELGEAARAVAARVEAAAVPEVHEPRRAHGAIATRLLVLAMVGVAVATRIFIGPTTDVGVLVRGGALVRGFVRDGGEWWRVISCVYAHNGVLHLLVNASGIWFVGRVTESLFGAWRTLTIFALAAVGGAVASYLASPVGMSVGASGGLMGIAGAVFAELTLHRTRHRAAWNRGAWGAFGIVIVSQLALGMVYSSLDQWAHGAGLAVGALAGAALSPSMRGQSIMRHAARILGIAFIAVSIASAVLVARTSIADSIARIPLTRIALNKASVTVPVTWAHKDDEAYDPDTSISLIAFSGLIQDSLRAELAKIDAKERERMKEQQLEHVHVAPAALIPLPTGWVGSELVGTVTDALGAEQQFRVVIAGMQDSPTSAVVVTLYVPEALAAGAADALHAIIASTSAR